MMNEESRLERWLGRSVARVSSPRSATIVICVVTLAVTVVAGLLMTVIDRDNYASLGAGLWWAAQTVTTVGYGDHVPDTVGGRLLAVLVMMLGIGFVTVITAAITSVFVARAHRIDDATSGDAAIAAQLRDLAARLERIEAALNRRS
jgi:voltage-gated potassium channel Kch